jgi:DedD protein
MERRAKERLIGASILVVLIVLIVPELLSGPKPEPVAAPLPQLPAAASSAEPTRTVTVDLATSKPPALVEGEAGAPAASAEPVASAASAAAASNLPPQTAIPEPEPEIDSPTAVAPAASAPQPTPTPVESAVQSPISDSGAARGKVTHAGAWAVQLGSFASHDNADKLVRQLKSQGFAVYMLSGGSGAATRHRVRVGPLADRDSAERTAAKLKALGHTSSLVPP